MPLTGLIIGVLLLIWMGICLNNWIVYPEETLRHTIETMETLHKMSFFRSIFGSL